MRYPEFLKKGGTIGVPAPSFGATTEPYKSAFAHAVQVFDDRGYRVNIGANVYADCGIGISSTPQACGRELQSFYCSADNDILISCGGGELMCEDLNYLDFDAVRKAPAKWFMGYSDNTNFSFPLTTLCDTASVYAACAPAFGMDPLHRSLEDDLALLTGSAAVTDQNGTVSVTVRGYDSYETESLKDGDHPYVPYNCTRPSVKRTYVNGVLTPNGSASAEGRLIGGCMDVLSLHIGTKFDRTAEFCERYKNDGILWFLEACDLNPMSIRRALWQMENAGWFRYASGFLIGRPLCGSEPMMGLDCYEAVCGILGKYKVPILLDMDIGHLPPSMPVIAGSYGKIRCEEGKITAQYLFR